jgi:hypothetical protein
MIPALYRGVMPAPALRRWLDSVARGDVGESALESI